MNYISRIYIRTNTSRIVDREAELRSDGVVPLVPRLVLADVHARLQRSLRADDGDAQAADSLSGFEHLQGNAIN